MKAPLQTPHRQPSAAGRPDIFTRSDLWVLGALLAFVAGTRLMFLEHSPASWDAASFWCAATDFNITEDRPHLPGYYLHVQLIRAFRLVLSPFAANVAPSVMWSMLATTLCYLFVRRSHDIRDALLCAMLLATNPMLWFYGCVSEMYAFDAFFSLLIVLLSVLLSDRHAQRPLAMPALTAALALGAGVRQSSAVLLLPVVLWCIVVSFRNRTSTVRMLVLSVIVGAAATASWMVPFITACGGVSSYLHLYATNPPGAVVAPLSNVMSMLQYGLYALLVPVAVWIAHGAETERKHVRMFRNKYLTIDDTSDAVDAEEPAPVLSRMLLTLWLVPALLMFLFTTYTKGYFLLIMAAPVVALLRRGTPVKRTFIAVGIVAQTLVFLAMPHVMPSMRLALAPKHGVSKWDKARERTLSVFSMTRAHLQDLRSYQNDTDTLLMHEAKRHGAHTEQTAPLSVFVDPTYPLTARALQPRHPDAQLCMLYTHAENTVLVHEGIAQRKEDGVRTVLQRSVILTTREVCAAQRFLRIVEDRNGLVLAVPLASADSALAAWYAGMFER